LHPSAESPEAQRRKGAKSRDTRRWKQHDHG
jgi:hypothetical protein